MQAPTIEEVMSNYNMDSDDVLALRAMWNGDARIAGDDDVLRDMEDPWEDTFPDISRDWPPPEGPSVTFQSFDDPKYNRAQILFNRLSNQELRAVVEVA
jgi:hypothetical protein